MLRQEIFLYFKCKKYHKIAMDICKFYAGKTVLITGATGFVGHLLIEKLLRSVPKLKEIIMVVRDGAGKRAEQRIEEYFQSEIFARLKRESVDYKSKVCGVAGNISVENFGVDGANLNKILNNVNVVFHAAATVNFNEKLKTALTVNLKATHEVMKLSNQIKSLESLVYVSTAYSNCPLKHIEEKVYQHPVAPLELIKLADTLSAEELEEMAPNLLGKWPNTYTYSKNASENLVHDFNCNAPVGIFRPCAVMSTIKEPFAGWINKPFGAYKIFTNISRGLLRTSWMDGECNFNIVPGDLLANCLIATAADVASLKNESAKTYNLTSHDNPVTIKQFMGSTVEQLQQMSSDKRLRYPKHFPVRNYWNWRLMSLFHHYLFLLPANVIAQGNAISLYRTTKAIHEFSRQTGYFTTQEWSYSTENVRNLWRNLSNESKEKFNFDMQSIDWKRDLRNNAKGIKLYLLKEGRV